MEHNQSLESSAKLKLERCDSDLACIRKDLTNFNQINKDFLALVRNKMTYFNDDINNAKDDIENKIKDFRNDKKNSEWALKMEMEEKLDKFESSVESTNAKVIMIKRNCCLYAEAEIFCDSMYCMFIGTILILWCIDLERLSFVQNLAFLTIDF